MFKKEGTISSAAQWQVKNASYCLSNPAATCTFYISFCRVGKRIY
jgi:hypothetical protein